MIKFLLFCIFLGVSCPLFCITYVINQSGLYNLGDNLIEMGIDVVQISADNVIFDLNENTIAGGVNGITIDSDLTNVIIRNGTINSVSNHGISIGQNCRNIRLESLTIASCGANAINIDSGFLGGLFIDLVISNITQSAISVAENSSSIRIRGANIANCGGLGLDLIGTSTAEEVRDVLIENIATSSCSLSTTFSHVVKVEHGRNVIFRNLTIANSGNSQNQIKLVEFSDSTQCGMQEGLFSANIGNELIGVHLHHTDSTVFQEVNVLNSCAISENLTGFSLTETSENNLFGLCRVLTSSALQGNAVGFNLDSSSNEIIFRNCVVASLIGNNVTGFNLDSSGNSLLFNLFDVCEVVQSLATTGTSLGFNINNADKGTLNECIASYNSSPLGRAIGLRFESGSGGDEWLINECRFVRNLGFNDAESFGIFVQTGTNNLFLQNFAFNNGQTPSNQMNGIAPGSITQLNPDNLNSAQTSWANIVVTI